MANLYNVLSTLDSWGVTDLILPFILIFAVLFALMQKVGIFAKKKDDGTIENASESKKFNAIISLTISLLVVIPHAMRLYPTESDPIDMINRMLPGATVIVVALLLFLILAGFLGTKTEGKSSGMVAIAGLVAIVLLLIVIAQAVWTFSWPSWLSFMNDSDIRDVVIALLLMGLIVYYIVKDDNNSTDWLTSAKKWYE